MSDMCESCIAQTLTIDGLERALSAHRRQARTSALMLTDALHALRHGAPGVVEEYLERTLSALAKLPAST